MSLVRRTIFVRDERMVDGVTILTLRHDFLENGEFLLKHRVDLLASEGRGRILLDLGQMANVDSADIGRLIRAHLAVRRAGGRIHLCRVSPGVRSLLTMTRLDTVFDLHDTEDEGILALKRSPL
ncbi:MAG: STAS domain-containing protein [Acidobacteriota bacterium]